MSESTGSIRTLRTMTGPLLPRGRREDATDADRGFTRVGILDGTHEVVVDTAGAVSVSPGAPLVDWWIAGDERWYYPSAETSCTQQTLEGTPVVETRIKVPGGEAIQRVYAIQRSSEDGGGEAVVVEVENASVLPFGLAFALRPYTLDGLATTRRVEMRDTTLSADGCPVLVLSRPPSRAIAHVSGDGDLAEVIADGAATDSTFAPLESLDGPVQAAVIVPVAHRTTYRAVLPLPAITGPQTDELPRPETGFPTALPTARQVADGWIAQTRTMPRVSVPDPRLGALLGAATMGLSIAPVEVLARAGVSGRSGSSEPRWDHLAALVLASSEMGMTERADTLLARAAAFADVDAPGGRSDPDLGWLVLAAGEHLARVPTPALATALLETVVAVVAGLGRRSTRRFGRRVVESPVPGGDGAVLRAAAVVFTQAGESRAAADALASASSFDEEPTTVDPEILDDEDTVRRSMWARHVARSGQGAAGWRVLDELLGLGSSTATWPASTRDPAGDRHCVAAIAAMASLAWALLVHVDDGRVRLLPAFPASWLGQKIELHDLLTERGKVGFVLRWHDRHPALLWQVEPTAAEVATGVDCAALDPTWHSHDLAADAMLAEVADLEVARPQGVVMSGLQIAKKPPAT